MSSAYIFDAVRTPRGKGRSNGALHEVKPIDLISTCLKAVQQRNLLNTQMVEDVILGVVDPVGEQGGDIARIAALYSGYHQSVPGVQINRFCASGLEAINMAAAKIMSGQSDCAIAGGVESMSRIPMMSSGGAWSVDPLVAEALNFIPQGISADLIATKYDYSRKDLDAYAFQSQQRALHAQQKGYFEQSIIPVLDISGNVLLTKDEYPRPETTIESLAELQPAFADMGQQAGFDSVAIQTYPECELISHVHHAGNSSGIVDGAAAVLIGNEQFKAQSNLKPRAIIRSFASVGSEPCIMLTAPADATERALQKANLTIDDIDLFEVNEAFAAVVLLYLQRLGLNDEKVNVNGGSIALGHPLGATGAMLLGTLLDELERRDLHRGLVTLCVGAGMGTATIIERV